MPTPYDTDCYDYDSDHSLKSKDDCSLKCENKYVRQLCNKCIPNILDIRKDLLNPMDKLCTDQFCDCNGIDNCTEEFSCDFEDIKDIYFKCNTKCKTECSQIDFAFTKMENIMHSLNEYDSELVIEPKTVPKVTISYIPSMTRTAYIANIGGIGGFWLGLNILAVYEFSIGFGKLLFSKFFSRT